MNKDLNKIWVKLNIYTHHEDHDMSSASQYHTRKCMLISVHVKLTLGVGNRHFQEFPMSKAQDAQDSLLKI